MSIKNSSPRILKIIIYGFIVIFSFILGLTILKRDCVYNNLENNKKLDKYIEIETQFKETMLIWHNENRKGFIELKYIDIGPIIVNSKNNKCYIILVEYLEKMTYITMIHGRNYNNSWEFTDNGTVNTLLPKFSNNRKSNYKSSVCKIINNFRYKGYVDFFSCQINDKVFKEFFFFEMDDARKYELENL